MYCNDTRNLTLIWVFLCTLRPLNRTPPEKVIGRRQIKLGLAIARQGQCPHQVLFNLANPDLQDLIRFLSQGLLIEQFVESRNVD